MADTAGGDTNRLAGSTGVISKASQRRSELSIEGTFSDAEKALKKFMSKRRLLFPYGKRALTGTNGSSDLVGAGKFSSAILTA
ncbi:hypothetical protein Tco_1489595 [Tanacetum coccineum]